jgi:hypothetical protein
MGDRPALGEPENCGHLGDSEELAGEDCWTAGRPGADSADLDSSFIHATLNLHLVRAGFPSGVVGTEVRIVANDAVGTADT